MASERNLLNVNPTADGVFWDHRVEAYKIDSNQLTIANVLK